MDFPDNHIRAEGLIPDRLGEGTAEPVYEFMAHCFRIQVYTEARVKIILSVLAKQGADMLTQGRAGLVVVFNRGATC